MDRISRPYLTKYEKTRIIGERSEQLARGAVPLVDTTGFKHVRDIALKELAERKLPFKIERPLPNGTVEVWRLSELIY